MVLREKFQASKMTGILKKIKKRIDRFVYKPIPVFVFHQVGSEFNPEIDRKCDWNEIGQFKRNIESLRRKYTFLSLSDAFDELKTKHFRSKRYAVLTADDAYLSVTSVIPFIEENGIPLTIFVNPKYLDGKSYSKLNEETFREATKYDGELPSDVVAKMYITEEQLFELPSNVSIAMHGYEHDDATLMAKEEFEVNLRKCQEVLGHHPNYIPFYAFTWGRANAMNIEVLGKENVVPVMCDDNVNFGGEGRIGRICIDGKDLSKERNWVFKK